MQIKVNKTDRKGIIKDNSFLSVPVAEGKLVLISNYKMKELPILELFGNNEKTKFELGNLRDHLRILQSGLINYKPIIISKTEKIEEGDWYYANKTLFKADEKFTSNRSNDPNTVKNQYKVLALPEHFSPEQLQMIVDGRLKDGERVLVECVFEHMRPFKDEFGKVGVRDVTEIKLSPHISLYPREENISFEQFNRISDIRMYLLNHPDKEMIRSSCLHYLGDKFQTFDEKINKK